METPNKMPTPLSTHHEITRKIYEKQHERIAADKDALNRIQEMYTENTFGIASEWFEGKEAIDVGCGNVGAIIGRLSRLGVKKVYAIDVGVDWIDKLKTSLTDQSVPRDRYELKPGSVVEIPYADGRFDFVAINGVLIHLRDMGEVMRGFREGARVCKRGGYYFTSYGPCGGLVQGAIFPAIRAYYRENDEFRAFIDHISPKLIHDAIDKVVVDTQNQTEEVLDGAFLKGLFGEDFCVFLQNYIQAPAWLSNECTPTVIEELYRAHGFTNIQRLNSFCRRTDIRKFFAPLHYDRDYPMSRILYGEGYVQYVAQKA
jgi:ubiquinone/menaquinone biosynthesis C-methylase UbiE